MEQLVKRFPNFLFRGERVGRRKLFHLRLGQYRYHRGSCGINFPDGGLFRYLASISFEKHEPLARKHRAISFVETDARDGWKEDSFYRAVMNVCGLIKNCSALIAIGCFVWLVKGKKLFYYRILTRRSFCTFFLRIWFKTICYGFMYGYVCIQSAIWSHKTKSFNIF